MVQTDATSSSTSVKPFSSRSREIVFMVRDP
jgi:hypothetical protein